MGIAFMTLSMVVYTVHVTCQDIDGGATEADGGASAPVGPSVATPLSVEQLDCSGTRPVMNMLSPRTLMNSPALMTSQLSQVVAL